MKFSLRPLKKYLGNPRKQTKVDIDIFKLLDPEWYQKKYPDIRGSADYIARHYFDHGAEEGRFPHPLFDTHYYLRENPDVAASGNNPLLHFLREGGRQGRNPHILFDSSFYLNNNPDVAAAGVNPLIHFIEHGANELRNPHPLFDTEHYIDQNPIVKTLGQNPLIHYLSYGIEGRSSHHPLFDARFYEKHYGSNNFDGLTPLEHYLTEGSNQKYDPNPFFDTYYYISKNQGGLPPGSNPLIHYMQKGESALIDPSRKFQISWYLSCYLDVASSGTSPLYHYLRSGRREGRLPTRADSVIGPVTDAEMACLREPILADEMALFVTHSPNGKLKSHVEHYLDSLLRNGVAIVLIVAADVPFVDTDGPITSKLNGIYVRKNEGFDFAAWAHVLRLNPSMYNLSLVYLLNDSMIGPTSERNFTELLNRIRNSPADFIGLVDSYESRWHIQSFFLPFKKGALRSAVMKEFFLDVVSHSSKLGVISDYELTLAQKLRANGLSCEVMFPQITTAPINRTLFHWKSLLEEGFPLVKVSTVADFDPRVDTSNWQEVLASQGFDIAIAERTVAERSVGQKHPAVATDEASRVNAAPLIQPIPSNASDPVHQIAFSSLPTEAEFDSAFYLSIYPDIAAAGVDPYLHYKTHGCLEGRIGSPPIELKNLDNPNLFERKPETILIVSHEGVRGGAPILAYTLVKELAQRYNVITLFLSGGPLLQDCKDAGAIVIGPIGLSNSMPLADFVVDRISRSAKLKFAIVNTIASHYVLPGLAKRYVPSISLIHEFAAYFRPLSAFREAVFWSGSVVFSAEITRDNAKANIPDLENSNFLIIPQGRCVVPEFDALRKTNTKREGEIVRRTLRPDRFPKDGFVVVGAGLVEFRKGVDLFISTAARVLQLDPSLPIRFIWVGRGYEPQTDVHYSAYLADQIQRSGLADNFEFLNEVSNLSAVFENSDVLMLSSRLDPLPNVAIDAISVGLPVLCFANTTGVASLLTKFGVSEHAVARYLDVDDLADKVVALAKSKEMKAKLSAASLEIACATFEMQNYITNIERIATAQQHLTQQEQADVQVIVNSGKVQKDFYLSPGRANCDVETITREYVRGWASGLGKRKLFPGFHPGIYSECQNLSKEDGDALAHFIRAGEPSGPWSFPLIRQTEQPPPIPADTRVALHIHAYFLEVFPEILDRLCSNHVRPDLLISVKSVDAQEKMKRMVKGYKKGKVDIRLVPDPGRDVGPFLTEFGDTMLSGYDLIGHVHTKASLDLADTSAAKTWVKFLSDNVLGYANVPMADIILDRMVRDPDIGIVFPDDPHIIGWDNNQSFVEPYRSHFAVSSYPKALHFPVGAFFWARPQALKPLFDLNLDWNDYPSEPLPYDGSLLHGIERLYGMAASTAGFKIVNTNIAGVTR